MEELLKKLREKDIQVRLDGTELAIHFDGDALPEDLLMELKRHKSDLIEFLSLRQSRSTTPEIPVQERPEHIPLSFNQERLWFIDKLVGSTNYHLFSVLRILGNLDEDILRQAFRGVVDRHEILRTIYLEEAGKAYQQVMNEGQWDFDFIKKAAADDDELDLPTLVSSTSERPFDLTKDYMLRVGLLALSDKEYVLILLMHHIASDGWSIPVFLKEFATLYEEKRAGKKNTSLAPLPIQYADYALWTRAHFQQEVMKEKLAYWTTNLSGVATLELKTDFPRSSRQSIHGSSLSFFIDPTLSKATVELASQEGTTLYMLLLAVFKVLLFKYTGQEDICVGTAIANRERKEIETLIGYFVNTIALRSSVQGELPFADFLKQVKETVLSGFEHQDIPFEKVVDKVVSKRDLSRNPIFQVMFAHQNYKTESKLHIEGLEIVPEPMDRIFTKFDLSFNVIETTEGLALEIEYCSDLFTPDTIHRLFAHYQNILHAVVANKNLSLARLPISDAKEFEKIRRFNDTTVAYPTDKTILDLFDEQVEKSPDNIALVFGDQQLTYRELEERSNQVAHLLQNPKRNANDLVGICLDRSLEMVVGLLGILKSGKAYVPIDPNYPEDRINYLVEDASLEVLLTDRLNADKLIAIGKTILLLDQIDPGTSKEPLKAIRPDQLAYVIYTSGTTGKPKGVKNTHAALWNRLLWAQDYFDLQNGQDVVLQKTTFCFDVSVWEFFWPLMTGVKLVLAQPDGHKDGNYLATLIEKEQITTIHFVPSMLEAFLLDTPTLACPSLKRVLCSGEALKPQQVHKFKEVFGDRVLLYNLYGPTEAAIDVTCWQVPLSSSEPIEKIPIGKPVSNTSIYILDEFDNPCGIGMVGELCIGGQQVSPGYWNREKLTQEKFTADPFALESGKKMYRSGDLACWLPDGNIEYIGRKDTQVKIRGHRIELGEIEFCLSTHPQIQQVVVATKDRGNDKILVAYVIANEVVLDKEGLRNHLKKELPDYMLPAHFVRLEALPLTANGKIDRRALPEVEEADIQKQIYVGPRNEVEEAFVNVWKEVLGLKQIGIYDNFFELGGDSIIVIQIVSRLKMLAYQLQPLDLFENQTIASLTQGLVKTKQQVLGEQGYLEGEVGLLPIQQHFFEKDFADRSHFNQSILLEVTKEVSRSHLEQIIVQLLEYHDALRLEYQEQNQDWIQAYGKTKGRLLVEDLTTVAKKDLAAAITKTAEKYQKSLSIEKGIVSAFVYIDTPDYEAKARFLMIHHHLVIDGISWRILVSQIENGLHLLAEGKDLPLSPKGSSFRQWSEHLKELAQRDNLLEELPYWKNIKNKYQALPTDVDAASIIKTDIVSHAVELDAAFSTDLLKNVNQTYQTNINDVLLAALAMTLCEWAERNYLTIGLESHGRDHQSDQLDITNTVGWFTDLYPVALSIEKKTDVATTLKSVKEQLRLIPNKGMGYGLLKYLHPAPEVRAELAGKTWDVLFNYLGQIGGMLGAESKWFAVADEEMGATIAPTYPIDNQLEINCFIADGVLKTFWNYSAKAFQENTIAVLAQSYLENLRKIIAHCQTALPEKTPSDFGLAGVLSLEELDRFFEIHDREKIVAIYPLSPLQEGILFHKLYDKDSNSYLEQLIVDFAGEVNSILFQAAWEELAKRHSILRTSIVYDQWSIPLQCVHQSVSVPFEIIKDKKSGTTPDHFLQQFLQSDQKRGFDFEQAPLFRITLLQVAGAYKMVFSFHHIIMDGWSLPVLMEAFMRLYEKLLAGHQLAPVSEDRYKDYIDYIQQKDPIAEKAFWGNYLKDFSSPTLLPFLEYSADRNKGLGGFSSMELLFEEKTTSRIKAYAQKNHLTVNTIIQGVWAFLLSQYANTTDVVYGVTVSGRPADLNHSEKRIGLYINTIPFRAKLERETNVIDWLSQLQLSHSAARDFQYSSLGLIKDLTGIRQDLFDSILVFENYPIKEVLAKESSLKVNAVELKEETNYLLTIIVLLGEKLEIRFKYNQLLKEAHVARIKSHFKQLVEEVIVEQNKKLGTLNILLPHKRRQLVEAFNNTGLAGANDKTLVDLFAEQVGRIADEIALVYEDKEFTFRELDERSNKLAHYLLTSYAIKTEDLIAVKLDRSEWMVIALLAVMKTGAAYVPIDPEYPQERIQYIKEDSQCLVVVDDLLLAAFEKQTDEKILPRVTLVPANLAYVIYTSGSTGNPKGVAIKHENVTDFFLNLGDNLKMDKVHTIAATTNFTFDISVIELLGGLCMGKKVVLFSNEVNADPEKFIEKIKNEQIEYLQLTPSRLYQLSQLTTQLPASLKVLLVGGEALSDDLKNKIFSHNKHFDFINAYGPTETTIWSTFSIQKAALPVTIGRPLINESVFILSPLLSLQPIGIVGELCVGGSGLARGYLHRTALTNEKFIASPIKPGERLYKTGDLARWLDDGTIEYIGRTDNQMKIRGYRIELGEIENNLLSHREIDQAVVLARENEYGAKELIAYLIAQQEGNTLDLRGFLQDRLPTYMIPSFFVFMDVFPMTPSGKIDRQALPSPTVMVLGEYSEPEGDLEKKLAKAWAGVLHLKKVNATGNFFALGGDSIKAIRLVSAIRKILGFKIGVAQIFKYPVFRDLAGSMLTLLPDGEKEEIVRVMAYRMAQQKAQIFNSDLSLQKKIEDIYPASEIQKGMIYHALAETGMYHDQMVHFVKYPQQVFRHFEHAVKLLIAKHAILRTSFSFFEDELFQFVYKETAPVITRYDVSDQSEKDQFQFIKNKLEEDKKQAFNIAQSGLFRFIIFSLGNDGYVICFVCHHAIIDGWSDASFNTALNNLLFKLAENPGFVPKGLKSTYKDFVLAEKVVLEEGSAIRFWEEQLMDYKKMTFDSTETDGAYQHFNQKLAGSITAGIAKRAVELKVSAKNIYFAAFVYTTSVFAYSKDILLGIVSNSRPPLEDAEKVLGCFLNTVPFRWIMPENIAWQNYLNSINEKLTLLKAYDAFPYGKIVRDLRSKYGIEDSIIEVLFTYTDFYVYADALETGTATKIPEIFLNEKLGGVTNDSLFSLNIDHTSEETHFLLNYHSSFIDSENAHKFFKIFNNFLNKVVAHPDFVLSQFDLFPNEEQQQILYDFNNTTVELPKAGTMLDLLELQVLKNPAAIALVFEDNALTYQDLDRKSGTIAIYLKSQGIGAGDLVGICLDRSVEMVLGLLGILKAAAAYVPIDPAYPDARKAYIIEDAQLEIILSDSLSLPQIQNLGKVVVPIDTLLLTLPAAIQKAPWETKPVATDLAYVIYTSGTTGHPKGVKNGHDGLLNRLLWTQDYFQLEAGKDVVLQKTTFCFDVSVWEFFWPLIAGVKLVLASPGKHGDPDYLHQLIDKESITTLHFVPSMLEAFLIKSNALKGTSLKRVLCSGEALQLHQVDKFKACFGDSISLYNLYGPTEAAIDVSCWEVPLSKEAKLSVIPIGRPVYNTTIYILDALRNLCPIGVVGELYIGGRQVAQGYLNRPDLTAEKFVENPFPPYQGTKMYRTGDLAKYLPDGNIVFVGRKDTQVKIRGNRIELGEIETVLSALNNYVKSGTLALRQYRGENVLVAYVIPQSLPLDKASLRRALMAKLPEYMIPGYIVELEEMPLSANGKLDRKALPEIEGSAGIKKKYVAPRNQMEENLIEIWEALLEVKNIGVDDNFFELGGHSLTVLQLVNRVKLFLKYDLKIKTVFSNPTISGITQHLSKSIEDPIPLAPIAGSYPVSSAQRRLWVLSQFEGGHLAYHIPLTFEWQGHLDVSQLELAFKKIVQRHEILRTFFQENQDHEIRQCLLAKEVADFKIKKINLSEQSQLNSKIAETVQEEINQIFDLQKAPLIRATVLNLTDERFLLIVTMHHIISDGWSMEILASEILSCYSALMANQQIDLPHLAIQYKDYSTWLLSDGPKERLQAQKQFWLEKLSGEIPVLQLPNFKDRPPIKTFNGNMVLHQFPLDWSQKILRFSQENDATLFMTLMAGIKVLFYRYTNQKDLIIGTPLASRDHSMLENQIGLYLNTLPIRTSVDGNNGFSQVLKVEKETLLNAYSNQNYPFDELVDQLNLNRDISRSPLFDVLVVLQNQQNTFINKIPQIEGVQIKPYKAAGRTTSQYDMTFSFLETNDGLRLELEYNTDCYDLELIQYLIRHLECFLAEATRHPDKSIDQLVFLSAEEQQELLAQFNDTEVAYPKGKTIVDLFEAQVKIHPNRMALVYEKTTLTYRQLDERSNQLANYLKEKATIVPEDLIAVKLERTEWLVISFLAILKNAAAYLPIDPNYPTRRIEYIEADSQAVLTIDERLLNDFKTNRERYSTVLTKVDISDENLAYVIYTSGTTGKPKGVMIEHRGIGNTIRSQIANFAINESDNCLQFANQSFDASIWEILIALLSGAKLCLLKEDLKSDKKRLIDFIKDEQITFATLPPAFLKWINVADLAGIKTLVSAGEKASLKAAKIFSDFGTFVNAYGPTETSICATVFKDDFTMMLPIGKPIDNTKVYILSDALTLQAKGVVGELCISGVGLARAYLNQEALTKQKFVENPFVRGERLYRTGDLARWLPDGNIEFLGRKDSQVKLKGYRIELEEVEEVLSVQKGIRQVAVDLKTLQGEKVMVAYYVAETTLNQDYLRTQLLQTLPIYMVPNHFVKIENIPLSPNGKVNRNGLPELESQKLLQRQYIAPESENEERMIRILGTVLGKSIEEIGITDNFFNLGANSLDMVKALRMMNEEFAINLTLVKLYQYPNVSELLGYVFDREKDLTGVRSEEENLSDHMDEMIDLL